MDTDESEVGPHRRPEESEHDDLGPVAEGPRPLVEPGQYEARCIKLKKIMSFGEPKLVLEFCIQGGPFNGVTLGMFCKYSSSRLKPATKLYEQWALALGRTPYQDERFAMKHFRNRLFLVETRNVRPKRKDGTPKPDFLRYSVVDTIIEPLAEEEQ